jgi:hypothetical protein
VIAGDPLGPRTTFVGGFENEYVTQLLLIIDLWYRYR